MVEIAGDDADTDSIDFAEILCSSNTISIDGTNVYKATVLKQMFSTAALSKDRLKRVRHMNRLEGFPYVFNILCFIIYQL